MTGDEIKARLTAMLLPDPIISAVRDELTRVEAISQQLESWRNDIVAEAYVAVDSIRHWVDLVEQELGEITEQADELVDLAAGWVAAADDARLRAGTQRDRLRAVVARNSDVEEKLARINWLDDLIEANGGVKDDLNARLDQAAYEADAKP